MAAVMKSPCPAGREGHPLEALEGVLPLGVVLLDLQVVNDINPNGGDVADVHAVLPQPLVQTNGSQIAIMDLGPARMHPLFALSI